MTKLKEFGDSRQETWSKSVAICLSSDKDDVNDAGFQLGSNEEDICEELVSQNFH